MHIRVQMNPMDHLRLKVTATIQRAIPGLPIVADGDRKSTGVVVSSGRSSLTAYFRDWRPDTTSTEKTAFQQRFQDRSYEALASELGAYRVKRVSALGGSKGVKVTLV